MELLDYFLRDRFPDYEPDGPPRSGSYGRVFVMVTDRENLEPQRFAVKTVRPDALTKKDASTIRESFERELRIWLRLPAHLNVLQALGLDFAPASPPLDELWPVLPTVRMPFCNISLQQWVDDRSVSEEERLLAVAQVCNGLLWMYEHGVEGHGDLKPDNLLATDLRRGRNLESKNEFPSAIHPWRVQVADLGWANAWVGTEGISAAGWRPYSAPERQDGVFIPEATDTFALGVIACELLLGSHPSGEPSVQVAKWSDKKWRNWVQSGERRLPHASLPVGEALAACLDADPSRRPATQELRLVFLNALPGELGEQALATLDLWTQHARKGNGSRGTATNVWAARQLGRLSAGNLDREISHLTSICPGVSPGGAAAVPATPETAFDYFEAAQALAQLLAWRGREEDVSRAKTLLIEVVRFAVRRFDDLDLRPIKGWRARTGPGDLMGFEAWEPTWSYAMTALASLRQLDADASRAADALAGELQARRRSRCEATP